MSSQPSATPRKRPKQERSQATVQAILTATARILTEEGYDHFTTNKVAELAGVSIGSLYNTSRIRNLYCLLWQNIMPTKWCI
jgi:DNA-binding transcriptional regulator YbjK